MNRSSRTALSLLLLLGATAARAQQSAPVPATAADSLLAAAAESRTKGAEDAPITIVELSDFQCPFCAEFVRTTYPVLDSAFVSTGKAKLIFHNVPLPNHPAAWVAAEAALCAGAQGAFWPMHDRLFAAQREWSEAARPGEHFRRYAAELRIDPAAFADCVEHDRVAPLLVGDLMQVGGGRFGTPTFILLRPPPPGTQGQATQRVISGVQPFSEFQKAVEELLNEG